jgi:predicted nucleic acid-binding protein
MIAVDTSVLRRYLGGEIDSHTPLLVIADCLVAQACMDNDVPLLTYDGDFDRFIDLGLKVIEV